MLDSKKVDSSNDSTTEVRHQRIVETPVCSREAVKALAKMRPQCIRRLFMNENTVKEFGDLCSYLAREHKLYRIAREDELEKLSGTVHHQGVVAMIEDTKLKELTPEGARKLNAHHKIVVLDNIGDDHNIGAIARTAAFFGFDSIILTGNKTKLTPGMYRVARGGLEYLNIFYADSAPELIKACPQPIKLAAAAHDGMPMWKVLKQYTLKAHTSEPGFLLALGNEEHGLSQEVLSVCPFHVTIQGNSLIESLNVTQAAAILMHELVSWKPIKSMKPVSSEQKSRKNHNFGSS